MSETPGCHGDDLPKGWHLDRELLRAEVGAHGTIAEAARAHGLRPNTLVKRWAEMGLPRRQRGAVPMVRVLAADAGSDDAWLLTLLKKNAGASVEQLADQADVSPKRVREALERLRGAGYRVGESDARVTLTKVVPQADSVFSASPALFDGDVMRIGVVSDTHLGAKEEALDELHAAYDVFQREGITEVWHSGDWGTGVGVFRTHHAEANVHTGEEQVQHLVDNYPKRDGIRTRGISGNHDLEGDFGRIGFDPVRAFAARRDDIDYLGEYGAWIELRPDTGSYVHLLHGAGGMSYAFSYKAQKLVDGYGAGRKPNLLIVGHWHVQGAFTTRNVKVLFPGCFEWQSRFMQRLGLQPAVGFHILEMTVADDGSIVRYRPEWFPFYSGRKVEAA